MKVRLREERAPARAQELEHLEREVGSALPSDFANFLSDQDGCRVEANVFRVDEDNDSGVNEFLSLDRIIAEKAALGERLSSEAWPIADAEGGNYVCLRREESGDWTVVFWDHEVEQETVLAQSFNEFLESLEKFDPETVKLKPGQVVSAWIDPSLLEGGDD
jgi:cell wall assembly regulator SMI1